MTSQIVTLGDFLGLDSEHLTESQVGAIVASPTLQALNSLLRFLHPSLDTGAARQVGQVLQGILSLPWVDLMGDCWNKLLPLVKYRKKPGDTEAKVAKVALGKHTFKSTLHPTVGIQVNGQQLKDIVFDLELELEVQGAILSIQDGKIMSVSTGTLKAAATLKCYERLLVPTLSKEFHIAGTLKLGQGMPIV
jgi:hypothetical protein